jgi:hypothetical protein
VPRDTIDKTVADLHQKSSISFNGASHIRDANLKRKALAEMKKKRMKASLHKTQTFADEYSCVVTTLSASNIAFGPTFSDYAVSRCHC